MAAPNPLNRSSPSGAILSPAGLSNVLDVSNDAGGRLIKNLGAPVDPNDGVRLVDLSTPLVPIFSTLNTLTEIILDGTPQTLITTQIVYQPNTLIFWSIALESNPATPGAPGAARFVLTVPGSGFSERGNNWEFSRAGASEVGKLGCSGSTNLIRPDINPGDTITLNLNCTGLDTGAGVSSLRAVASSPPELGPQYMLVYAQTP